MIFVYLIIIVAALAFINFITNRLLRNMKEDYGSMLSNSEKSDEEERKKNDYIFLPKDM